ncbi:MAG: twin-arginine translocation signal domain-containing protein [Proteobacteria bacterium]|nr:twin-arginine translocation signal domain-containing protein [Pseudomonadota bacterium]
MKQKNTTGQTRHNQNRRDFLKKSSIVGASVVVTTTVPAAALANAADQAPEIEQQKGYHVTQHVIDYYKSAAI